MKKLKKGSTAHPKAVREKKHIPFYGWCISGGVFAVELIIAIFLLCERSSYFQPSCTLRYVLNPDIRENLHTCGQASKTQACALYIMNHTRYDKKVVDFVTEASRLTDTPVHLIMVSNPNYVSQRIVPGYFAQIKIPPVN